MKIENQVCGLDYSKRFKNLGIGVNSLFYHVTFINSSEAMYDINNEITRSRIIFNNQAMDYEQRTYLKDKEWYSAFTATELLEKLKKEITIQSPEDSTEYHLKIYSYRISCDPWESRWYVNYVSSSGKELFDTYHGMYFQDENLANALSKVLILLIESDVIKILPEPEFNEAEQ